jgi:aspartate beta-hydroxylase
MIGALSETVSQEGVERALSAGDLQRALRDSEALLDSDPSNVEAIALRGAVLLAGGRAQAAVDLLQAAARDDEAPYAITSGLAICQAAAGDRTSALISFQRALTQHPDEFSLRLVYAECLEQQGMTEQALPQYFRAVHDAQVRERWLNDATTGPRMRARVKRAIDRIDSGRQVVFEALLRPHIVAFGTAAMQRVSDALGVYLGTQAPINPDPRQRPKFLWVPGLTPTAFYPAERFQWVAALEAAAPDIRAELNNVLEQRAGLTPFLEVRDKDEEDDYLGGDRQGRAWDAFFFHRHGVPFASHLASCPDTVAALAKVPLAQVTDHAPEVLFSILAPNTHIKPHHGVTNTRVVTHLPLIIPQGDCKLVVGGEEHAWQEGRCVTFDDTFLHEAWNRTDQQRVVLIMDTWNPDLTEPERIALRDLVEGIGAFNTAAGVD